MVSKLAHIAELSWSDLVHRAWQREGGTHCSRANFESAAREDAVRSLRPLFAPLLAHLTGWAASLVANPLERQAIHSRADRDRFFAPVDSSIQQRLQHRLDLIVRTRLGGYRAFLSGIETLEQFTGPCVITRIESLGDTHVDGDCVRAVTLQDGHRYIYKPRPAYPETALARIARLWVDDSGLVPAPVASSSVCCWWSDITQLVRGAAPANTSVFGQRYGQALAFATALAWDDLHYENVLMHADGIGVALVDTEMAWGVQLPADTARLDGLSPIAWLGLRTYMLPCPLVRDRRFSDESPLSKFLFPAIEDTRDVWELAQRSAFVDYQYLLHRDQSWFSALSQGVFEGIAATAARIHTSDVGAEIECSGIAALQTRFVYRPTRAYFGMLRDAILREVSLGAELDIGLWDALFKQTVLDAADPDAHHRICRIELSFLRDGSIPIFWTNENGALVSENSLVLRDFRSDLATKGAHVRHLHNDADWQQLQQLAVLQIDQLRKVVSASAARTHVSNHGDDDPAAVLAAELAGCAVRCDSGQSAFLDFAPTGNQAEWGSQIVGRGLYRGAAGIGLALWATAQHAPHAASVEEWSHCFADATAAVRAGSFAEMAARSWSMSDGVFGIAYALSVIGSAAGGATAVRDALDAALLDADLSTWKEWDFLGGWAGALACYAAIARRTENQALGEAGQRLCERVKDVLSDTILSSSYANEPGHRGLAHGAAGVVYALGRARALWPDALDERLLSAAVQRFTTDLTPEVYADWPNAGTWCGGASGVIRAFRRLGREGPPLPDWFVGAAQTETATLEHVCCGRLGKTLSITEADSNASDDLKRHGQSLLVRAAGPDFVSFEAVGGTLRTLGFFQGVAGALYYGVHLRAGVSPVAIEMAD